jgi:hypothetical protein
MHATFSPYCPLPAVVYDDAPVVLFTQSTISTDLEVLYHCHACLLGQTLGDTAHLLV